jgi:hypothetical protein
MEKKNPLEEARRYMDNAKKLLVENGELDVKTRLYGDKKYVRMAGWGTMALPIKTLVIQVSASLTTSSTGVGG